MTWEQTIEYIRTEPSFSDLVEKAYLEANLVLNVERFSNSEEFLETLQLIKTKAPGSKTLLDIGSGNGISAVAFALKGYAVTAVEPDPSNSVGAGAIRRLKEHYQLTTLDIVESYAEDLVLAESSFDVIYARQCLHHAYDLPKFLQTLGRMARPGTLLISARDHVIYDAKDKERFLASHPLQKYYGGENAFTLHEYQRAIQGGGFNIVSQFGHFDSVINYFPMSKDERATLVTRKQEAYRKRLKKKLPYVGGVPLVADFIINLRGVNEANILDESRIPGRMYTFVSIKS